MTDTYLSGLNEGQFARVTGLLHTGSIKRRLQDLGLVAGTKVRCLQKSPHGDPAAYSIRGAVIALRHEDARFVTVDDL